VYGCSSVFHSVSWHAASELIMYLIRYDISLIFHMIYISVITNTKDISARVYLSYAMRTTRVLSISMLTGSIGDDYIFANSDLDASKSAGIKFSTVDGVDDGDTYIYISSTFRGYQLHGIIFDMIAATQKFANDGALTECDNDRSNHDACVQLFYYQIGRSRSEQRKCYDFSDYDFMVLYNSDNYAIFSCHFYHDGMFHLIRASGLHICITGILLDDSSFSNDNWSCGSVTTQRTNRQTLSPWHDLDMVELYVQFSISLPVTDEYAGAAFYRDHGLGVETQLSDLSRKFNIAANDMTGIHVHYMMKSGLVDILRRILRTTYGVSVDCDDQHPTLVLCLVHFDARNTIAATTHIWNMILTTKSHSEGMAHDNASTARISEAEFYDFNLNSIGGYATARVVTALTLVALMSRCSYDFPTIVAILYGGRDFKYMHHAEDYIVFTNVRVIRSRDIDQTVSYCAVSIVGQAMKPRGNSQSSTALPLFMGHESPFNAMQTDVIFLQQDETADFDNVNGSVINLNNIIYSIIAGSTAGSVLLKVKMMNACGTEATKIVNNFEGYMAGISYSLGNFSPLSILCDAEFSRIFGRLSANHAVFSYQFDYSDMISLLCISDHYAFISEVLYACINTSLGTDYCSINSALITNYFHRHRPNRGRDEHNCTTKPFQSQQRGPTNGDFTDVFGTIKIASTALIGGYVSATTTTQRRRQNVTSYWSGG
jgi:hypothetical protein